MSVPPQAPLPQDTQLKRRARLGMLALSLRSVLQNLVILGANVYLARLLEPGDYGVFGILQFAVSLFRLVGETGLGAALIQKQEPPDDVELSTIFWLQLGLGLLLVGLSAASVPLLPLVWPTLPVGTEWLLPGLALSLLFTMLRIVPFLVLERAVQFGWLGTLEFLGTLVFYGTALVLAQQRAGAASFVWASVLQAALVAVAANLAQPWRPKWVFSWVRVRPLLKFGFAFQGNNVVGFINGAVTPLLVGAKLGKEALGMINFAQGTAWFPTHPVGIVRRVFFPYLSRLQHDRTAFVREFEFAVALSALPTFFFFALFLGGAPELVTIIYGEKWQPAVAPLYVYSLGFCFAFYVWIAGAAIEALGQTGRLFRIQAIGAATNWTATVAATFLSPTILAFACGYVVHLLINAIALLLTIWELVPEAKSVKRVLPVVAAGVATAILGRLSHQLVSGVGTLATWILVAAIVFLGVTLALDPKLRAALRTQISSRLSVER